MDQPSGTVTPDDFRRIRQIFEEALLRAPVDRQAFVHASCGDDRRLLADVERMLTAEEARLSLLDARIELNPAVPSSADRFCASCTAPLQRSHQFCPRCGSPTSVRSGREDRFRAGALFANRFRIVAPVGHGGMGEVYRAHDLDLGQPVALKFLRALRADERARDRLRGEVRLARQIAHPNVCRVYDIGESQGELYLTMEFVDGEDLATLLKRIGRLPVDKGVEIARKLCAGLAAAHAKGVLHRDFKPANIMVDARGEVRIMDFGLAAVVEELDTRDVRSGTPAYMAPEQLAGKEATRQSDLYALGLVMYELFTGKPPFDARDVQDLQRQRGSHPSTSPSSLVPELGERLQRAILRCLEPDPKQRPASALDVAASLPGGDPLAEALMAGETPSPELVAAAGERKGFRPVVAWSIAALVALACIPTVMLQQDFAPWARVAAGKPPDALVDRARNIIVRAGHAARPADFTYDLVFNDPLMLHLQEQDRLGGRARAARARDAVLFTYRESPQPLERITLTHAVEPLNIVRRAIFDPTMRLSGEVLLTLTGDGHLRRFIAIPPADTVQVEATGEPDWGALLAETGLDITTFSPVAPELTPIYFADTRRAWIGSHPDAGEAPVRIEAAALGNLLVGLEVIAPWTESERVPGGTSSNRTGQVVILILIVVGVVMARRNVRSGRGDLKGASRLAACIVAVFIAHWVFTSHHVPTMWEAVQFFMTLSVGVVSAGALWLLYVALEPETRRRWPHVMVSWTRLLAGHWRDPLVGRDVLIGCATGVVGALLVPDLAIVANRWGDLPLTPRTPIPLQAFIPSFGRGVAFVIVNSVWVALLFSVAWLALRLLMRRVWLAGVAWVLLFAGAELLENSWFENAAVMLQLAMVFYVLTRVGWLAYMVGRMVVLILIFAPVTMAGGAWFADTGIAALAVIGLLIGYAGWASTHDPHDRRATSVS